MTDDHRERRVADASKLLETIKPYMKVGSAARTAAVHNELMFAVDRVIAQHEGNRFNENEINVLKDISFTIIHTVDPMNRQSRGFVAALNAEFKEAAPFKKVGAIAATLAFMAAAVAGGWAGYKEVKGWSFPPSNAAVLPEPPATPITPTTNTK